MKYSKDKRALIIMRNYILQESGFLHSAVKMLFQIIMILLILKEMK